MVSVLSIVVIAFAVLFGIGVCVQVGRGNLLLRYSLLWLILALVAVLCAVFPQPLFAVAYALGFNVASNFVFFLALLFFLLIALSLSVIVSKQQQRIKKLTQHLALLENSMEEEERERQSE